MEPPRRVIGQESIELQPARDAEGKRFFENGTAGFLRCAGELSIRLKYFNRDIVMFSHFQLIMKLAIQDIQPYSVLVSWQSREHSGLSGYQVIYHSLEVPDEVRCLKSFG